MTPMTLQDVFTKAVIGFRAQRYQRSVGDHGACMYRGGNGRKCLIGHAIPDDKYNPRWDTNEGGDFESCWRYNEDFAALFPLSFGERNALVELQCIHDGVVYPSQLERFDDDTFAYYEHRLHEFAAKYDLIVPDKE